MIHLSHSAAPAMARRRRLHAAGSALWALALMLAGAAAAWYTCRISPAEESGCHINTVPFYPLPDPPAPAGKSLTAYRPAIVPGIPDLPIAEPENTPAPAELALASEYEPDDLLPETDAEALLAPPTPATPHTPAPQKKKQIESIASTFTPPAYLNNPKPPYPPALRRRRIQGQVSVLISVTADGIPSEVCITRTSGDSGLDRHTRSWILKNWRFSPARQNGKAIAAKVSSMLNYSLHH